MPFQQRWIGFDGKPLTGVAPAQLISVNGRPISPAQFSEVAHHFKLFLDAVNVSPFPDGYHVQNRVLPDGTKVRMESMQRNTRVFVEPVFSESFDDILHGIGLILVNADGSLITDHTMEDPDYGEIAQAYILTPQVKPGTFDGTGKWKVKRVSKLLGGNIIARTPNRRYWISSFYNYMFLSVPSVSNNFMGMNGAKVRTKWLYGTRERLFTSPTANVATVSGTRYVFRQNQTARLVYYDGLYSSSKSSNTERSPFLLTNNGLAYSTSHYNPDLFSSLCLAVTYSGSDGTTMITYVPIRPPIAGLNTSTGDTTFFEGIPKWVTAGAYTTRFYPQVISDSGQTVASLTLSSGVYSATVYSVWANTNTTNASYYTPTPLSSYAGTTSFTEHVVSGGIPAYSGTGYDGATQDWDFSTTYSATTRSLENANFFGNETLQHGELVTVISGTASETGSGISPGWITLSQRLGYIVGMPELYQAMFDIEGTYTHSIEATHERHDGSSELAESLTFSLSGTQRIQADAGAVDSDVTYSYSHRKCTDLLVRQSTKGLLRIYVDGMLEASGAADSLGYFNWLPRSGSDFTKTMTAADGTGTFYLKGSIAGEEFMSIDLGTTGLSGSWFVHGVQFTGSLTENIPRGSIDVGETYDASLSSSVGFAQTTATITLSHDAKVRYARDPITDDAVLHVSVTASGALTYRTFVIDKTHGARPVSDLIEGIPVDAKLDPDNTLLSLVTI